LNVFINPNLLKVFSPDSVTVLKPIKNKQITIIEAETLLFWKNRIILST